MIALLVSVSFTLSAQETPLEQRLENLRGAIMLKLEKLRSAKQVPTSEHFRDDLRALEALQANALRDDLDTYTGALLFEANLLAAQLHEPDRALKCYDLVLALKNLPFHLRGHTLIEKATLLRRERRLDALDAMVKDYAATADADEGLRAHLEGILRRARLVPGTSLPALDATDLDGKPIKIPSKDGHHQVVAFLRLRGSPESKARETEEIEQAGRLGAAMAKLAPAGFVVVSMDLDREAVVQVLRRADAHYPVVWQDPADAQSLGGRCGIHETPAIFILDGEGKISSDHNSATEAIAALDRLLERRKG